MLPIALLIACSSEPPTPLPPQEEAFAIELPAGGCDLPAYDWVAPEELGKILSVEYQAAASFPAPALDLLLTDLGLDMFTPVPYGTQVYRVRYLTQDRGQTIEATALLAFPDVTEPQDFPTLLWVRPTVGFSDSCAPSGQGFEAQLGQTFLASMGFAVAAPDLLGMNGTGAPAEFLHPYIVPEPTAVAALDSVRALWRLAEEEGAVQARPTHQAVLWGASEGGFGAIWADRYGQGYLPEIEIEAVVASVPPTDLLGLTEGALSDYTDATEGLVAVLTTGAQWYQTPAPLQEVMTDVDPSYVASTVEAYLETTCDEQGAPDPTDTTSEITDLFQPDFVDAVLNQDWAGFEGWRCMSERGTLSATPVPRGSQAPVLYQVSEEDQLVLGYVGRAHAPVLCEAGYELEYLECAGADHVGGAALTLPYQLEWVRARLAGVPIAEPCVIHEPIDCAQFGVVLTEE